ncbi:4-hydroxyphenylacetate 3-hydroxylase family protein [Eisenibacter elegans]|jgi:4-hydroxybutyryl-CoA dehydratase/vinylacetyl-CoA-Delta-isomerase|uniref:4-hydroxyphenylacetate 3-hydroxylase family protein n=1 Tax=Eisenibacter elegans TaxID=997 RepID=UPI0003FEB45B|nr:4-hydroxyphenylacetate 3-hydroxylase N-terminal domain-containing protein [Eisenibacter elegans]
MTNLTIAKINSAQDYLDSLRGRKLKLYLMGEPVDDITTHPIILPSINAMAATYRLAEEAPELATVVSPLTGERISRFLHVCQSADDLVMQNKMQRRLGQLTGTCFQRCVGMDAINALYSVSYEIDEAYQTSYHQRFLAFLKEMHLQNCVIGGAMTDVKGDRSLAPHEQADPDLFVRITRRTAEGVYISGAKAHQTGCLNAHYMLVMPTMRLGEHDRDYAIIGAIPVDAEGITYIYGRQSCDTRSLEPGSIDVGNAQYGGQEAMVIFDNAFIPNEWIFMDGEYDFAALLVDRFTAYHRRSYVCKSGVGDVVIGAAAAVAEMNGVEKASHIKDKLVEMTHLNETVYATGIAASYQGYATKSGCFLCDSMLANTCKHHVTKMPYEISRLAQDLAGGMVATMPSEQDLNHPEIGQLIRKYLKGKASVPTEDRMRMLRLIENLTLGRNAVGYLTESLHGAGSPQAQRVQIARLMQLEYKKRLATVLAGIELPADKAAVVEELGSYFERVFKPA